MPAVSAVVAPLVGCDVALPALSEGEWLFRLAMPKDSLALTVGDIFIQSPDRRTFLNHSSRVNNWLVPQDGYHALWCDVRLIHSDHNRHSYSPCLENVDSGSSGNTVSFDPARREVAHLVDVSLHTTREARLADRAAPCGMLVASSTGQTLHTIQA